jgi:hypothetical protein
VSLSLRERQEETISKVLTGNKLSASANDEMSKEALIEAMGEAISAVTAEDARGFFEHCGYRRVGQLLW